MDRKSIISSLSILLPSALTLAFVTGCSSFQVTTPVAADEGSIVTFSLKKAPFSYKGAVLSITDHHQNRGLTIQDVSGKGHWRENKFFLLRMLDGTKTVQPEAIGSEGELRLSVDGSAIAEACFEDADTLRLRGRRLPMTLLKADDRTTITLESGSQARIGRKFSYGQSEYSLKCLQGSVEACTNGMTIRPDVSGNYEIAIVLMRENKSDSEQSRLGFDECVRSAKADFADWLSKMPTVPEKYRETRAMAGYVLWSATLNPGGLLKRPGILMSKNWMIYIWSWDHCFNAISCSYGMPDMAFDQLMVFAQHQTPSGQLPDLIGQGRKDIGLIKPPIHGWTLRKMRANSTLTIEQIQQAYDMVAKLTDYMTVKRASVNGLPAINDAMDSGWDNMSECEVNNKSPETVNYENAGHCSYLILQMDELHDLALKLGKVDEAGIWRKRSDELMAKMIARLWTGDRFVMRRSDTGDARMDSQSLNRFMPLILGEKLRKDIRDKMVADLKKCGNLTAWGAATECPTSPNYKANGYWLGPIWAPPTLFLVDGLNRCGEQELAKDLARRFCDMCVKSGFAENFDALTGDSLRDPAYTWTVSTFLILAHDYLLDK